MKVRALINCNGVGYEHLNKGEERDIPKKLAEILIQYKYVEEIVEPANQEPEKNEKDKDKNKEPGKAVE